MLSFEKEAMQKRREQLTSLERRGTIKPRQARELEEIRAALAAAAALVARPSLEDQS
jgi:hypothetical protein